MNERSLTRHQIPLPLLKTNVSSIMSVFWGLTVVCPFRDIEGAKSVMETMRCVFLCEAAFESCNIISGSFHQQSRSSLIKCASISRVISLQIKARVIFCK